MSKISIFLFLTLIFLQSCGARKAFIPVLEGFERTFDDFQIRDSRYEQINACPQVIEEKVYDKNFVLLSEMKRTYSKASNQSCDFSAYIEEERLYEHGKLKVNSKKQSASHMSDEIQCGTWTYYKKKGKADYQINYGDCDLTEFEKY